MVMGLEDPSTLTQLARLFFECLLSARPAKQLLFYFFHNSEGTKKLFYYYFNDF